MSHYRTLVIATALTALAMIPIFIFLSWLPTTTPQATQSAMILEAFKTEELTDNDYLWEDRRRGLDSFSDCAVLAMVLARRGNAIENALYSQMLAVANQPTMCRGLRLAAEAPAQGTSSPYHRYWHGTKTSIGIMMMFFDIAAIRQLLMMLQALGWAALAIAGLRAAPRVGAFVCVVVLFAAFFSGYTYYGPSLTHAPSFVAATWLAAVAMFTARFWRPSLKRTTITYAIWGACAVFIDSLTALPVHVILAGLVVALLEAEEKKPHPLRVLEAWASFVLSAVILVAAKQVLAALVAGPDDVFGLFFTVLRQRIDGGGTDVGLPRYNFFQVWPVMRDNFFILTWGMRGAIPLLMWFGIIGWGLAAARLAWRRKSGGASWWAGALPLVAILFATVAWYSGFNSHALTHRWFMTRPLFLLLSAGWAGIAWSVVDARMQKR